MPTSDNIDIVRGPEARAYVREFSGFATEASALEEAVRLKADLLQDKVRHASCLDLSTDLCWCACRNMHQPPGGTGGTNCDF